MERSASGARGGGDPQRVSAGSLALSRLDSDFLELQQRRLREQTVRLRRSQEEMVRVLAAAVELRDGYTGAHIKRVASYATILYNVVAPGRLVYEEALGFTVHDIGKLGIPDSILLKPEALTRDEERIMRKHPIIGAALIQNLEFLSESVVLVRHHHERWDGNGYPDGLSGRAIPLAARIFAVADSLDAATSDRPYRQARPLEEAVGSITSLSYKAYDPEVIAAFTYAISEGLIRP